jgi:hypothetical protein
MENEVNQLLLQADEIKNYKPYLRVIKNLEKNYRTMYPRCPKCHQAFDLKNIISWVGKDYAKLNCMEV